MLRMLGGYRKKPLQVVEKKMVKIWLPIFEEDMVSNKVGEFMKKQVASS